jgi:hypothetical protein
VRGFMPLSHPSHLCLLMRKGRSVVEMKRQNTIGDRVNIIFCGQTYGPKCRLSLFRVFAAPAVCLARCLRKGHLYFLFPAKPDSLSSTTRCLLNTPPVLTLYNNTFRPAVYLQVSYFSPNNNPPFTSRYQVFENLKKLEVKNWTHLVKDRKTLCELVQKTKVHKRLLCQQRKKIIYLKDINGF